MNLEEAIAEIERLKAEVERQRQAREGWREKYFATLDAMSKLGREHDQIAKEHEQLRLQRYTLCWKCGKEVDRPKYM